MTLAVAAIGLFASAATAGTYDTGTGWKCTADKIVEARYKGKKRAYIHLEPYGKGDWYGVKLNDAKTEATGKTGNGTTFVCKKG